MTQLEGLDEIVDSLHQHEATECVVCGRHIAVDEGDTEAMCTRCRCELGDGA